MYFLITSIIVFLWRHGNHSLIGFVELVGGNDTNGVVLGVGCGTGVIGLLNCRILRVLGERNVSTLVTFIQLVVAGTWVHVSIGHAEVFPDICTDPISRVSLVHWDSISLILAGSWHIEILGTSVKLHAESELRLLLTRLFITIERVGIREVEVRWNVILGTWHSHELDLIALLLLYVSDLGCDYTRAVNCRTLTTL